MVEFLLLSENIAFSCCMALIAGLLIVELVTMAIGGSLFELLDMDMEAPNAEAGINATSLGNYLLIGRIPVFLLLLLHIANFAIFGLVLNGLAMSFFGQVTPMVFSIPIASFVGIVATRGLGLLLIKHVLVTTSNAVSEQSFVGRTAVITLGEATKQLAAEAKLQDDFGKTHYLLVKPDNEEPISAGTTVVLFEKRDDHWLCAPLN